ncbi:MAG TPA: hypothetical protein VFZ91_15215 [Allosphingosinicella sp.]
MPLAIPIDLDVVDPVQIEFDVIGNIPVDLGVTLSPIEIKPIEIKPLTIELKPLQINLGPIEVKPIDFSLRIKEIPSVRVRLPMDYKVCVNLLGHELASVRLCGQGQVITEPYVANPCECRPARIRAGAVAIREDVEPVPAG